MKYQTFSFLILITITLFFSCEKEPTIIPQPSVSEEINNFITIIQDDIEGTPVVLAGSENLNIIVGFDRRLDGEELSFTAIQDELPLILSDEQGNKWDIFGQALEGPEKGARLNSLNSSMGYWFIFGAMYPGVDIFNGPPKEITYEGESKQGWAIPTENVFQPVGLDGIPSIDDPRFITYKLDVVTEEDDFFLRDRDMVMAVAINGEMKVYPHKILDWHEIVNDVVGGVPIAITYCPLTGTGRIWERTLPDGKTTTFGVSGFLYNSNVIPFDRETTSLWTQLDNRSIFGTRIHETKKPITFVETSWETWQSLYDESVVLSNDTGFDRNYNNYPYGNYRTNHQALAYPVDVDDDRMQRKERVFGFTLGDKARVYPMEEF